MASNITTAFEEEFEKLLETKHATANDQFQSLQGCLRTHNCLYSVESINVKFFLTHKANRGGLLLSPHNVHRNAARIHLCGADLKQLNNAICMELAPSGKIREEHLTKNKLLIKRANGLLAPINGSERYLTLGCGHTTAFCKQAAIQGRTSQKALQCADSEKVDLQKICSNMQFKTMIMDGWTWEVVPHIIDELFPAFAKIAQTALNTQNHISTEVGELETCMTLAANADDPGMQELEDWQDLAIKNVEALCVPCSKYSKALLHFVITFGGGAGAPLIAFMDAVTKQFGCNVDLGQGFWEALAHTTFPSKTCLFPLIRIALALANLTTDKIEDNVARLLSKADVKTVAGKPKQSAVMEAERALNAALEIATPLGGFELLLKPLGQMFVRVGLMAAGKEKQGRERTTFTLREICSKYLEDIGEIVGKKVTFSEWDVDDKGAQSGAGDSSGTTPKATSASLRDHSDPVWVAAQSGFSVGKHVVQKSVESSAEGMFVIFSIGETVELRQVCRYSGEPVKVQTMLQDLLTAWACTKTEPPMQMQGGQCRPKALALDMQRCMLFRALLDLDAKHVYKHDLTFWRRPDEVRTQGSIKEGQLVLVPVAPMLNISTKNTSSGSGISLGKHEVEDKTIEFFVIPLNRPQLQKEVQDAFPDDAVVAAFWWVSSTTDKKQANMALTSVTQNGVEVPVLKNIIDVSPKSKLYMWVKPKAKTECIQDAIERAAAKTPPGKKQRHS